MAETVYVLCFLTSVIVAALLLRGYRQSRHRLLLWTSLGFVAFSINNAFLIADLVIFRSIDLSLTRSITMMIGVVLILFAMIFNERD